MANFENVVLGGGGCVILLGDKIDTELMGLILLNMAWFNDERGQEFSRRDGRNGCKPDPHS